MSKFVAEWSGRYPCLCSGAWSIKYQGKDLDIPSDRASESMGTYISYQTWHFEDWNDVWEDEEGGMDYDEWIMENHSWVCDAFNKLAIANTDENYKELYYAIQSSDFRSGSCGGCI